VSSIGVMAIPKYGILVIASRSLGAKNEFQSEEIVDAGLFRSEEMVNLGNGMWESKWSKKLFLLAIGTGLGGGLYLFVLPLQVFLHQAIRLLGQGDVEALKTFLLSFGVWAPVVSFLLMVLQSLIAPLPAFVLTLTNGLVFGQFWGATLSWGSAMVGAALCFGLSRIFGHRLVKRLVSPSGLARADTFFVRYGKHAVLVARLLPWISFDLVSYGAGLTPMGFWGFWSMTGIGQLPATLFYTYLGHRAGRSLRAAFFVLTSLFAIGILMALLGPFIKRRLAARH
jgi:uncharacterized membrane protein YdjX (TVP38/TMEM64 family)